MKKDGGAAFPNPCGQNLHHYNDSQKGMTLRDYFAAKALQGMHASLANSSDWPTVEGLNEMAIIAYDQADAMLAARDA